MTKRRKWTAIPGLIALAAGAVMLSAYSGASSSQNSSPTQPIAFPHSVHVRETRHQLRLLPLHREQVARPRPPGRLDVHGVSHADRARSPGHRSRAEAQERRHPEAVGIRRPAPASRPSRSPGSASTSFPSTCTSRTCATSMPASPARPVMGHIQTEDGLPVRVAEHGLVRELPRERLRPEAGRGRWWTWCRNGHGGAELPAPIRP